MDVGEQVNRLISEYATVRCYAIVRVLLPKVDIMNTVTNLELADDYFDWLKDGARGLHWQDEIASIMLGK